jgi:hypothetical protein
VDAAGAAAIVYAADLRWGPLRTGYGALLHAPAAAPATVRQVWRSRPPAVLGRLHWQEERLGAEGSWEGLRPGPAHPLADGIRWRCHQPGGPAHMQLPGGGLAGLGYAEELTLEVPPWRLPFRELLWGRFIPAEGGPALAWIRWRGGSERQWCFQDGRQVDLGACSEAGLQRPGQQLRLQPLRILREGPLLQELLGPLAALWPGALGRAHERKELARGTLREAGRIQEGWAIHERVYLG